MGLEEGEQLGEQVGLEVGSPEGAVVARISLTSRSGVADQRGVEFPSCSAIGLGLDDVLPARAEDGWIPALAARRHGGDGARTQRPFAVEQGPVHARPPGFDRSSRFQVAIQGPPEGSFLAWLRVPIVPGAWDCRQILLLSPAVKMGLLLNL